MRCPLRRGMSASPSTKIRKKRGPKTEPRGTPDTTLHDEGWHCTWFNNFLFSIVEITWNAMTKSVACGMSSSDSFEINLAWGTVSNALIYYTQRLVPEPRVTLHGFEEVRCSVLLVCDVIPNSLAHSLTILLIHLLTNAFMYSLALIHMLTYAKAFNEFCYLHLPHPVMQPHSILLVTFKLTHCHCIIILKRLYRIRYWLYGNRVTIY